MFEIEPSRTCGDIGIAADEKLRAFFLLFGFSMGVLNDTEDAS